MAQGWRRTSRICEARCGWAVSSAIRTGADAVVGFRAEDVHHHKHQPQCPGVASQRRLYRIRLYAGCCRHCSLRAALECNTLCFVCDARRHVAAQGRQHSGHDAESLQLRLSPHTNGDRQATPAGGVAVWRARGVQEQQPARGNDRCGHAAGQSSRAGHVCL